MKRSLYFFTIAFFLTLSFLSVWPSITTAQSESTFSGELTVEPTETPAATSVPTLLPTPTVADSPQPQPTTTNPEPITQTPDEEIDPVDRAIETLNTIVPAPVYEQGDTRTYMPFDADVLYSDSFPSSAQIAPTPKLLPMRRTTYLAKELIPVTMQGIDPLSITAELYDPEGESIDVIVDHVLLHPATAYLRPENMTQSGKYKIVIHSDELGSQTFTQDFNWGVLAINTNQSIYSPNQIADISLAVLNELGEMVCDATVTLDITDPSGNKQTKTTTAGSIVTNPECFEKSFTTKPDYQTSYQTNGPGVYTMTLTAVTKNGQYAVRDAFEVRENLPFTVTRESATRIYPPSQYPVTMTITAHENFVGTITEMVPQEFEITPLSGTTPFSQKNLEETSPQEEIARENSSLFDLGFPLPQMFPIRHKYGSKDMDPLMKAKYDQYKVAGNDGVDFIVHVNEDVLTVDDGTVVRAGDGDYGMTIIIEHDWGRSYYGHLSEISVKEGEAVTKKQRIGATGSTGLSGTPYFHFALKPKINDPNNGYYGKIDPLPHIMPNARVRVSPFESVPYSTQTMVQKLQWNVRFEKGKTYTLGYAYKAPNISPEFYTLGPLRFESKDTVQFSESRVWQIAADAVAPDAWTTYSDSSNAGKIKVRKMTNTASFGSEVSTALGGGSTVIYWVKTVKDPTSTEVSSMYIDSGGQLYILRCTGSCDTAGNWSELFNISTGGAQNCVSTTLSGCNQTSDIAYEQLTGRLMIVYETNVSAQISYQVYNNGSSVIGATTITLTTLGATPRWASLKPKGERFGEKRTNEMLLTVAGNSEVSGIRWTGSSWTDHANLTSTTNADTGCSQVVCADGAWEQLTGDALVVWLDSATNYKYRRLVSGSGSWDAEANSGITRTSGNDAFIQLASDPASDRIGMTVGNKTAVTYQGQIWKADGSTAGWTAMTGDAATDTASAQIVWGEWERFTNDFIAMYADAGSVFNSATETADCSGSGCTFTVTDIADPTTVCTTAPDDMVSVNAGASWNTDEVTFLQADLDNQLLSRRWSGTAIDAVPTACIDNDLSTSTENTRYIGKPYWIAYIPYAPWGRNWRWYDGLDGSGEPSAPTATEALAAENTAITDVALTGDILRLRFQYAERGGMGQTDTRKKLQYTTGCTPNTSETSCTWTDVDDPAGSGIWRYVDINCTATDCADGTLLTSTVLTGSGACSTGNGCGTWIMDKDAAAGTSMDHNAEQIQESEFVIEPNSPSLNTTYYFRIMDANTTSNLISTFREQDADDCGAGSAACTYPSLTTTASSGPTNDQLMRHGKWFSGSGEQPFTF